MFNNALVIQWAFNALIGVLGYFLIRAHHEVDDAHAELASIRRDFGELSLRMVSEYVKKTEIEKLQESIEKMNAEINKNFIRLYDKLDKKADKKVPE